MSVPLICRNPFINPWKYIANFTGNNTGIIKSANNWSGLVRYALVSIEGTISSQGEVRLFLAGSVGQRSIIHFKHKGTSSAYGGGNNSQYIVSFDGLGLPIYFDDEIRYNITGLNASATVHITMFCQQNLDLP